MMTNLVNTGRQPPIAAAAAADFTATMASIHKEQKKKQEETNTEIQEEKDKPEQITGKHQEEKTTVKQSKERQKGADEEMQHDVSQKGEEYKPKRDTKDKLPDERKTVQESLESPMEKLSELEKQEEQINLSSHDVRIVLLGKTGSGKSATGNTILGRNVFKEYFSAKSVTKHYESHETTVNNRNISVTDTPGLFDTTITNEKQNFEIEKCVEKSVPGPHVFLVVLRLGRFTEEEKNTMKWIQENFGEDASRYTIILFTYTDLLEDKSLEKYITESSDLQALLKSCGDRYHSFNNKDKSNQTQVTELLQKIDNMVKINGGKYYTNENYQQAQRRILKEKVKQYGVKGLIAVGGASVVIKGCAALATGGKTTRAVAAGVAAAETAVGYTLKAATNIKK